MAVTELLVCILASSALAAASTFPEQPFVGVPLPQPPDTKDCRTWKWADACRSPVKHSIAQSEWPSFLTYKAWDSCQGCLSAGGVAHPINGYPADNSAESFQVIGDWMRISSVSQGNTITLSTANSAAHWFNPPRSGTSDRALELEWYVYVDASDFGSDLANLTLSSWSAFWAFGHGTGEFGWPTGGELDFLEWLPDFSGGSSTHGTAGATTGFHDAISGAYPPCCMKPDNVTYPENADPHKYSFGTGKNGFIWPTASKFRSWGQAFNVAKGEDPGDAFTSDRQTSNTVMHVYARCTTTRFDVWVKPGADPSNPPHITNTTDPGKLGYAHVFRGYGDFGSNADSSFADAFPTKAGKNSRNPNRRNTNWHQNLAFVWSVVRFPRNNEFDDKKLLFYISDIHLRGGGNSSMAMAPPHTANASVHNATVAQDTQSCDWISGGVPGCNGRLEDYMKAYSPHDYGANNAD